MRLPALITAALLSAATACAPAAPPSDAPPSNDPPAAGQSGALAAAQRSWEAARPAAYAYTLEISCFCLHRGRYALEVRNGQIASARDAATGAAPPADRVEWLLTVDRLFEAMRQASQAGTPVRATYHPQQGYPTEVEIGLLANDSGTLYRIENLRAL
ncbi:MAG TPA: DUF6174 domain-containing protein [Longimicrobium sp.]|nr:DUF6174 domain-containing protein [Longimicrobium sp.]